MTHSAPLFTAIGSLPHPNVDSAIEYAFRMSLPFLPQIPIRNSWEFMLPQALEGLPGLRVDPDGTTTLNGDIWASRTFDLKQRLDRAFETDNYSEFEPSPATSSCWYPFLWELGEREIKRAKIQIAGPLTCQWALRLTDGQPADSAAELGTQIFSLVLARSIAMARRLKADGIKTVFFFDEPALYQLSSTFPKHVVGLQQLKVALQTLKREGCETGVHCCSETDWSKLLDLPIDWLSLDAGHSLQSLLSPPHHTALMRFHDRGGRLSLGIIPTLKAESLDLPHAETLQHWLKESFRSPELEPLLHSALFTPACGLAYHSVEDAEEAQLLLTQVCRLNSKNTPPKNPEQKTH